MRVLLTGASGFVGHHILKSLISTGFEVIVVGRKPILFPVEQIEVDLLNVIDFLPLVHKARATHLMHLAWFTEHGKYWDSPLNLKWVETSTRLVKAFCESGGKGVIISGTCAEYDWSYGYCEENTTPFNPATTYGDAKKTCRNFVMEICAQFQVSCAWGLIFFPYGLGENSNRLIPMLIEVFRGKRLPFGVDTNAYRDFIHVSDLASGFVSLLTCEANGVFNVSTGCRTQLKDVIKNVAHLLNADPEIILALNEERLGDPILLVGANYKLKSLGWSPRLSLNQGLQLTIGNTRQAPV